MTLWEVSPPHTDVNSGDEEADGGEETWFLQLEETRAVGYFSCCGVESAGEYEAGSGEDPFII